MYLYKTSSEWFEENEKMKSQGYNEAKLITV